MALPPLVMAELALCYSVRLLAPPCLLVFCSVVSVEAEAEAEARDCRVPGALVLACPSLL